MDVDRAGDVLQPRAHLQRQPERRGEFRHAVADRLDPAAAERAKAQPADLSPGETAAQSGTWFGDWVIEALESVLNQHIAPREIIIIDDGSTDDTSRVLSRFGPARRVGPSMTVERRVIKP